MQSNIKLVQPSQLDSLQEVEEADESYRGYSTVKKFQLENKEGTNLKGSTFRRSELNSEDIVESESKGEWAQRQLDWRVRKLSSRMSEVSQDHLFYSIFLKRLSFNCL